jgi:nitric oxide dioxygenase
MISDKTIQIVKATVPVLEENGEALTRHFYERMFKHNPEVLPFFNPANQTNGTQQRALATAICAYASHIDDLGSLGKAVNLISNKHASLRIQPNHYPIVGENILASIKEVLGDAATDEIVTAWGEAYNALANILIDVEKGIYAEQEKTPGSWKDFKNFKVVKKEKESDVITSFYLEPEDGKQPPAFKPGQYITVRVPSPCGHTTMRNYSLSDKPHQNHFRISVKREDNHETTIPDGYVSNMLHDAIEVGGLIEIAPPAGEFFLNLKQQESRPLVLIAAGVGITPILSMLLSILDSETKRDIIFIHANTHENNQAFKTAVDDMAELHDNLKIHYRYSEPTPQGISRDTDSDKISEGIIDIELIQTMINSPDADFYFCGPKPFMVNLYHALLEWGVPIDQINFEFFGPQQEFE